MNEEATLATSWLVGCIIHLFIHPVAWAKNERIDFAAPHKPFPMPVWAAAQTSQLLKLHFLVMLLSLCRMFFSALASC
jgi:hypothetical protein